MPTTVTQAKRGAEPTRRAHRARGSKTQDLRPRMSSLEKEGFTREPPYDHPWIIAGQGTARPRNCEDVPDVETVLVPVGGGGLSAGVATAIKCACRVRVSSPWNPPCAEVLEGA